MVTNDSLEAWIRMACLLEATARKPGNVHPGAAFSDLSYRDFVLSANVVAPILAQTPESGVGTAVLQAVEATQAAAGTNTNLGICLLLAPLAAVPREFALSAGIGQVLNGLTRADAALVYRAIRAAHPGGMGQVDEQDVSQEPTEALRDVMRLAAGRDRVAEQYVTEFALVLEFGVPLLSRQPNFESEWETVIVGLHLYLMAEFPDTLIARKCGLPEAVASAQRARHVLDAGWLKTQAGRTALSQFDRWLRGNGHRRNPGTTADLVTACLFAAMRDGVIPAPPLDSIQAHAARIAEQSPIAGQRERD